MPFTTHPSFSLIKELMTALFSTLVTEANLCVAGRARRGVLVPADLQYVDPTSLLLPTRGLLNFFLLPKRGLKLFGLVVPPSAAYGLAAFSAQ